MDPHVDQETAGVPPSNAGEIIAVVSDAYPAESSPSSSSSGSASPVASDLAQNERRLSTPNRRNRCHDCGLNEAIRMCICQFPMKSFCQGCAQMHLKRKGPKMHLLVPMHASVMLTSEQKVPDFITREVFSNQVSEALINNLSRVTGAKEDLKSVCERLHSEINQYRDSQLKELDEIEQEMKLRVEIALKGIEEVRYVPDFEPKNEPERMILEDWRCSLENLTERLSMFVATAMVEHIVIQLPSISHFHANYAVLYPPTSHQARTYLPCIQSNSLKSLSLPTHTWRDIPLSLHTDITYSSAVSFLSTGDLFACGGKTHNKAYIIDGLTLTIQEISPMTLSRHFHGLVATPDFAYVFGGKALHDLKQCEKYDFKSRAWVEIQSMHKPRSSITPCRHYLNIYIAGGAANSLEKFNMITDVFTLHPIDLPLVPATTCVASEKGVLILTKDEMLELNLIDFTATKVASIPSADWWSTISPVFFNGEVYFCRRMVSSLPQVYKVSLQAKKLELVS